MRVRKRLKVHEKRAKECNIRSSFWWRRLMTFFIKSNKRLTQESAWFRFIGYLTAYTVLFIFQKGRCTTEHSSFDVIMPGLVENITSWSRRNTLKGWAIHMDKARPHNSRLSQGCNRTSKAERLSHPADGLVIVPSDFLLLRSIKKQMSDCSCASLPNLLKTIAEFFSQTDKALLISVVESWIKRP
jgi:hypothetical protein